MMFVTLHGNREVEVEIKFSGEQTCGRSVECERMFDRSGSETFDPTEAVECDGEGRLWKLEFGDEITVRVLRESE